MYTVLVHGLLMLMLEVIRCAHPDHHMHTLPHQERGIGCIGGEGMHSMCSTNKRDGHSRAMSRSSRVIIVDISGSRSRDLGSRRS